MFGVVDEAFGLKETLLVRGKDKVLSTGDTRQHTILEIHLRPSDRKRGRMPHEARGSSLADRQNHTRNSRLGPEPYQISSGESKVCQKKRQTGIVIARFVGLRDGLKGQW
jgi:hypothetical protein